MNRLLQVVAFVVILLGCVTLVPEETRNFGVFPEDVLGATTQACMDVGARISQFGIQQDTGWMFVTAVSATHRYMIGWESTGDSTQTKLVIKGMSGAYAETPVYDAFWAALEAHL